MFSPRQIYNISGSVEALSLTSVYSRLNTSGRADSELDLRDADLRGPEEQIMFERQQRNFILDLKVKNKQYFSF